MSRCVLPMVGLFTAPSVGIDGVKEEGKEEAILAGTQPMVGSVPLKVQGLCGEVGKGGECLCYCGRCVALRFSA